MVVNTFPTNLAALVNAIDRHYRLRERTGGFSSIGQLADQSADLPNIYFVDSGHASAADGNDGRDPNRPLATIAGAVAKVTANRGDIIVVLQGHAETLTAAIALSKAGVTIIGLGVGNARPALTGGAIDYVNVTGNDCHIENIRFVTPSAAGGVHVNINAARLVLKGCRFEQGANSVSAITVTASGELPTIEDCEIAVTANGPAQWILYEGVVDRPIVRRNHVVGSDGTNAYDNGMVNYGGVAVTNPITYDNTFLGGGVTTTVVANNGAVVGELTGPNSYAGSATSADNVSSQQELVDALFGSAGLDTFPNAAVPANGVSIAEVLRSIWAGIEGTAAGENGIVTWPAAAAPADGVSLAEAVRHIVEALFGTLVNTGGTATLGGIVGDVANTSIATRLTNILAQVGRSPAFAWGDCDAGMGASTTVIVTDDLTGYGNDFFNTHYFMQVIKNANGAGAAPESEVRQITDYVSATGTFTVNAFSVNVEANDTVLVIHESIVALGRDDANNIFASANVVANEDGSILERLEQIQEAINRGTGSSLPANTSLADFVGKGTGAQLAANESLVDVLYGGGGISAWPAAAAPANGISIAEAIRYIVENLIGTLVNTGGTATLGGILGDLANDSLVARLNDLGSDPNSAVTDNLQGKLGTDTELADRSLFDLLVGDGPAVYPAAAAPANDVSIAEVARAIYDRQLGDGTNAAANSRLGKRVQRAAADIFDGTTKALFTVAGGRVLITQLTMEVTVAGVDANPSNCKLISNPTVGADRDLCAVLDVNNDQLGSLYSITGLPTDALDGGSGGGAMGMSRPFMVAEGTIDVNTVADVGTGGALIAAEVWYIPLDDGATVVAA